jgi:hypothetical protein
MLRHRRPKGRSGILTEREAQRISEQDLTLLDGFNGRFSLLIAGPMFGAHAFSRAFHAMQTTGVKILDVTAASADAVGVDFFEELARAWCAPVGCVPRVAVVLPFDRWTLLRETVAPCSVALARMGTELVLFYQEQGSLALAQWLTDGGIRHDVERAVRSLLHDSWTPRAAWPQVVAAAADLVRREAPPEHIPRLLACLSAIALGCGDPQIAEPLAHDALVRAGAKSSAPRALALRTLGSIRIAQGRGEEGIHVLELAVETAERCHDRVALAAALCHLGVYKLAADDNCAAENCFRRAIEIGEHGRLDSDIPGVAHHGLAMALLRRGLDQSAAIHAAKARAARLDPLRLPRSTTHFSPSYAPDKIEPTDHQHPHGPDCRCHIEACNHSDEHDTINE